MQFTDWRVHCPVCDSTRLYIDENPDKTNVYHELACSCQQCDATFSVVYKVVDIEFVRYGNPIGPVYLTDYPQQALNAWDADENQWILTDGTSTPSGMSPRSWMTDGRTIHAGGTPARTNSKRCSQLTYTSITGCPTEEVHDAHPTRRPAGRPALGRAGRRGRRSRAVYRRMLEDEERAAAPLPQRGATWRRAPAEATPNASPYAGRSGRRTASMDCRAHRRI